LFEIVVLVWADTPAVFTYTPPSLTIMPHSGLRLVLKGERLFSWT
jgi:hypothetical protein